MNLFKAGAPFHVKDMVEYEEGKAVKKALYEGEGVNYLVVALDNSELPEHAAPENALITILDGTGDFTWKDQTFKVHHGMNIYMNKGDLHSVKTDKKLKFSLILMK